MKECVTHHHACDCREANFAKLEAALALPEDSKTVNAELYGLAVELADSAARSDIECLCVRTGADRGAFRLVADDDEYAAEVARAVRYLAMREASGEPMPYKVVRDGDKVRFEWAN